MGRVLRGVEGPRGNHPFPVGKEFAKGLGYPSVLLAELLARVGRCVYGNFRCVHHCGDSVGQSAKVVRTSDLPALARFRESPLPIEEQVNGAKNRRSVPAWHNLAAPEPKSASPAPVFDRGSVVKRN